MLCPIRQRGGASSLQRLVARMENTACCLATLAFRPRPNMEIDVKRRLGMRDDIRGKNKDGVNARAYRKVSAFNYRSCFSSLLSSVKRRCRNLHTT